MKMSPASNSSTNSIKTEIALIKQNIKQIEEIYNNLRSTVDQITEIRKSFAVQQNILDHKVQKIDKIEQSIVKYTEKQLEYNKELSDKLENMRTTIQDEKQKQYKDIMNSIEAFNKNINDKIEEQNRRITSLENWRWYIIGAAAVIVFILNKIPLIELSF
jgi:chromosome segregation ATPase